MRSKIYKVTAIALASLMIAASLAGCGAKKGNLSDDLLEGTEKFEDTDKDSDATYDADIDIDAFKDAAGKIGDLDLDTDVSLSGTDDKDAGTEGEDAKEDDKEDSKDNDSGQSEPEGELIKYSYTDVYNGGNDITVIPNGGLNESTRPFGNKDLNGFLDYVDSTVLEKGRNINRELFYDNLAIMLVDKVLSSDQSYIENNMAMALAVANNFYDTDVKIKECHFYGGNGAEYSYNVTAYGRDDVWTVDYSQRKFYMNDGSTEYSSDMWDNQNLAVWLVAMQEYFGLN